MAIRAPSELITSEFLFSTLRCSIPLSPHPETIQSHPLTYSCLFFNFCAAVYFSPILSKVPSSIVNAGVANIANQCCWDNLTKSMLGSHHTSVSGLSVEPIGKVLKLFTELVQPLITPVFPHLQSQPTKDQKLFFSVIRLILAPSEAIYAMMGHYRHSHQTSHFFNFHSAQCPSVTTVPLNRYYVINATNWATNATINM